VRGAIAGPLADILAAVHATLEETPPELAADITKEGILLAGGGALLRGLDERLEAETGMPVRVTEYPLECVALGAGQSLEELDRMGRGRR
jgi:rod shape-determining protein MreB and related proteins